MDLRKVAAAFETTEFDAYDEALQTWIPCALTGKVLAVDRFLSNFNRPTKRRLLGIGPGVTIPASFTIRVPSTSEIYFMGELRRDAEQGAAYDQVGVLHRSVGTATINRKAPAGPSNDPGWLVSSAIGTHYADAELRADSEIDEHRDLFEGQYFLMFPPHADLQSWDSIVIGGDNYMVNTPYLDSGFAFARATRRVDPRQDFVYHQRGATVDYNTTTRVVTSGLVNFNVTGFAVGYGLGDLNAVPLKAGELKVIVDQAHIGFVPASEDQLTWDGQLYLIHNVKQDFLKDQYQLDCTL